MDRFAALAEPTRRDMIELLGAGERSAGDIGKRFPLSAPAVSQHLRVLREAGLVRVRVDGQRRIYSLDPAGFAEMDDWFARMRAFWSHRLDRLEQQLHEESNDD